MNFKNKISSQLLLLVLAGFVFVLMLQIAQAQTITVAQSSSTQSQVGTGSPFEKDSQVIQVEVPQKNIFYKVKEATSLTYYHQFLGPTLSGPGNVTYNVFQEGMDTPRSGRSPLQSFHAANLRFQINPHWAVGTSLAAVDAYTRQVENRGGVINTPQGTFFNARAYISTPAIETPVGSLFSTISYEAPTSVISRNDNMLWGWVLTESFAFKSPNPNWAFGLMGQYYRTYFSYKNNMRPPPFPGGFATPVQTVIVSGGPYVNYRFNDHWQLGSLFTFDWDQRGLQTDTSEFNNNLPHRGRLTLSYFPSKIKYLTSVGVFSQALLKYRPETTAMGADFSLKF
jgi:hypothetical protein